jgi:tryptophan-rich sensory protein
MILDKKLIHILVPVIVVLIINYIIISKKWRNNKNDEINKNRGILPSGLIIGIIWIFIFICMGNSHYILYKKSGVSYASLFLIAVLIFCALYPIVTELNQENGRVLNTVSLILSSILMLVVYSKSLNALYFIFPLFIWSSYVNISDAIVCSNCL